ncbi:MAG: hypothetical protein ACRC1K_26595 [Planctomycetia bacterium]
MNCRLACIATVFMSASSCLAENVPLYVSGKVAYAKCEPPLFKLMTIPMETALLS